jgi:predicted ATPase
MLTRLEADGFKNLLGFEAEFGPYTCIAGPNAIGKSNIFDVIEFLSLLADKSFMEAALELRLAGQRGGDPAILFWQDSKGRFSDIRLAAEMVVPPQVEDDFGREVTPTTTFLRYEIVLRYVPSEQSTHGRAGRIQLVSEQLKHINKSDTAKHIKWPSSKQYFRDSIILGRRSGIAYISTHEDSGGASVVEVHQDGGSRGRGRTSPAQRAPRTVVSTTTTIDDPTILAARREMQSWRKLSLEPSAMRAPDSLNDPSTVDTDGSHLAGTLYRLALSNVDESDTYAEVSAAASSLVDVRAVDVELDPQRDILTLRAQIADGPFLPAKALSDGTLRFLALCIIAEDADFDGVICMEEPENGIHPARIPAMVRLLRELAVDPSKRPGRSNPLRQVIVNTHSPYFVVLQQDDELLLAAPATIRRDGEIVRTVRLLPKRGTWRTGSMGFAGSQAAIVEYLRYPEDAPQMQMLDMPDRAVVLD